MTREPLGKTPVRRAGAEDAPTVARLLHDFNTEFSDPSPGVEVLGERLARLIGEGEVTVLLGGEDEGVSLFRLRPALWAEGLEAYLQELYVVPARRRQGMGRALLEATIERAIEAGAAGIDLNTGETDTAARALYESAGFTNCEGGSDGPRMLFYEREFE